jgi:hypothetical protein
MVGLLRHQVLLLAMKAGRAPLPVSPALWRGLQRYGLLDHIYDIGSVARRLLFVGDARILLAELRRQNGPHTGAEKTDAKEIEISAEDRPKFQDARQ